MTEDPVEKFMYEMIERYKTLAREELKLRWDAWSLEMGEVEKHEVIAALLARQVTLATQLASNPGIWNGHIAPLILRSMVDNYINLAWIFMDPQERSKKFIEYGLGQQKLMIEHRKKELEKKGVKDPEKTPEINGLEAWVNSQRYTFLTTVSVGSWADRDTRKMAEEADCLDLYRYAYTPFSSSVHSQWDHISRYNLETCSNPLHRYHKVPIDFELPPDPDYFYRSAKYVEKAFKLFDDKLNIQVDIQSAFERLNSDLEALGHMAVAHHKKG
ncbi:MAG TPA: hypothetical protein DEP85_06155 [Holosporales bacterium]|nr:hypothetical protein [Holosporales bacterium]